MINKEKEELIIVFMVLQVLDAATTYAGLQDPHNREIAPLAHWFIKFFGLGWGIILQKILTSFLGIEIIRRASRGPALLMNGLMTLVVFWNLSVLWRTYAQ